jgi:prepilin-type processing-associated H-X9-DG protein
VTCDTPPNSTAFNNRAAHGPHAGGVQGVMCDGHVAWVGNGVDFLHVYRPLFTRNRGEVVALHF